MTDVFDTGALAGIERRIDEWLAAFKATNDAIEAVERGPKNQGADDLRWYVRMRGEAKEHTTIWMTLGQRTLRYEAYVMPAPEENVAAVYEQALRRNEKLVGAHFAIGVEDALFLRGEIPVAALTDGELDRIIGSLYAYVEQTFPSLIRLGYASRFA